MHHDSKKQQAGKSGSRNLPADADREHLAGDSSIFNAEEPGSAFLPVPPVLTSTAFGTIEAAVAPIDLQYFGFEIAALASGGPLAHPIGDHPHRVQAKDLVAELRDIGSQVSRMMAQVERAIDRFALHAG